MHCMQIKTRTVSTSDAPAESPYALLRLWNLRFSISTASLGSPRSLPIEPRWNCALLDGLKVWNIKKFSFDYSHTGIVILELNRTLSTDDRLSSWSSLLISWYRRFRLNQMPTSVSAINICYQYWLSIYVMTKAWPPANHLPPHRTDATHFTNWKIRQLSEVFVLWVSSFRASSNRS